MLDANILELAEHFVHFCPEQSKLFSITLAILSIQPFAGDIYGVVLVAL
jgi:hypothetical protein